MQCLIKWYCCKCDIVYVAYTDWTGHLKAECPECKEKTDYDEVYELETLQVG